MTKQIFIGLLAILFLTGTNCKDEPLPPCTDCPQLVDTTSHDFTFYVDTLGDGSSSVLRGAVLINDTNITTVGEISVKDSNGEFINPPFNVAQWDGQRWSFLTAIDVGYLYGELYCLLAFSSNDVWAGGTIPIHWNGIKWTFYGSTRGYQGGFRISKLWGTSSNSLYVVGGAGNIRFFNGTTWQPISTGTTLDFKDIWGDKNTTTGEYEIYAVASKGPFSTERKIFRINGTTATEVSTDGIPYSTNCIWFKSQKQYYVAGGGMWKKENITSSTPWQSFENGVTQYYIYGMRGQSENDIVAVGSFGELLHYNGKSWKSFRDLPGFNNLELYSVDIKGNTICAVGYIGNRACVVRGYRK